jgi:DUF1365 family protein
MDLTYRLRFEEPGERLRVGLQARSGDDAVFDATLSLRRREVDRRSLGRVLWSTPLGTHRVSAGIYRQAATLVRMRAPFHRHPARSAGS